MISLDRVGLIGNRTFFLLVTPAAACEVTTALPMSALTWFISFYLKDNV
jgi:hypothetical protein